MPTLTEQQIKEIAEQLDCGFRCFWHKTTGELLFVPDLNNNPYADTEFYEDDLEKLDNNFGDYIEIEKPTSSDSFEIMANFTEQLNDNEKIKNELINALNKKKPFREFKFVIDNSGIYRQHWFDFKNAQLKQWVSDKFNEATYDDRENGST
jgi:hypothetical protein